MTELIVYIKSQPPGHPIDVPGVGLIPNKTRVKLTQHLMFGDVALPKVCIGEDFEGPGWKATPVPEVPPEAKLKASATKKPEGSN